MALKKLGHVFNLVVKVTTPLYKYIKLQTVTSYFTGKQECFILMECLLKSLISKNCTYKVCRLEIPFPFLNINLFLDLCHGGANSSSAGD